MNKQTFLDIEERALLNIDKCPLQQFCVTFIPSAFYKAPELEETGARLLNNNRLVICDIFLHNSGQVYVYRVKRMIIPRWSVSRTKIKQ